MGAAWDEKKYVEGVDNAKIARYGDGDDDEGLTGIADCRALDLPALTKALKSSFFIRYVHFAISVDEIPTKLASFGESCVCHAPLLVGADGKPVSEYRRRLVIQDHYGAGMRVCPMAGKNAPELAAGKLFKVLEQLWNDLADICYCECFQGMYRLDREEYGFLQAELTRAKQMMTHLLHFKAGYMGRLPYLLLALAVLDESEARQHAIAIVEVFEKDPRPPPVHHELTWRLLKPTVEFRVELGRFIAGCKRSDCSIEFQVQIAVWRFAPVVETTIEEKHARTTMQIRHHVIGPVRHSLANRLPLLERRIARDPCALDAFLDCFESMRSLNNVIAHFGFESHPLYVGIRESQDSDKLSKFIVDLLYHTDRDFATAYRSLRGVAKANAKQRVKRKRDESKFVSKSQPSYGGLVAIEHKSMEDHFKGTSMPEHVYSIPAAAKPSFVSLQNFYDTVATAHLKSARILEADAMVEAIADAPPEPSADASLLAVDDALVSIDDADNPTVTLQGHDIFFQVVFPQIGNKKAMKLAPGAGRTVGHKDVSVMICRPHGPITQHEAFLQGQSKQSDAFILKDLGNPELLRHCLKQWQSQESLKFTLGDLALPALPPDSLADIITQLKMSPPCDVPSVEWLVVSDDILDGVRALHGEGLVHLVEEVGVLHCALSPECAARSDFTAFHHVVAPAPALVVRADVALEDKTAFELYSMLGDAGFAWRQKPAKREKLLALPPYKPGEQKLFYARSTLEEPLSKPYMLALLTAEVHIKMLSHLKC